MPISCFFPENLWAGVLSWLDQTIADRQSGSRSASLERSLRRRCELGEIAAPADLDGVGFDLMTSQQVLCDLQRTVVVVQERALKGKAGLMRRVDPTLSLKDYRPHSVQTLFGTLVIRIPRLARHGSRLAPPCLFRNWTRSSKEYDQLRSRLGAFMSYRMVERLVGDLFPFAVGRARCSTRRQLLRMARHTADALGGSATEDRQAATTIDLGIDTTFIRSNSAVGPRHHEVLIGVGSNDWGQVVKAGAVIAASDKPHDLIQQALNDLGQSDAARITTFTDGDKMLRGYLKNAGVAADPILDWQHLSAAKIDVIVRTRSAVAMPKFMAIAREHYLLTLPSIRAVALAAGASLRP